MGFQVSHIPDLSICGATQTCWQKVVVGKGGRVCFSDHAALDELMMPVNMHPKGLKSVVKHAHAFLLGFQSRETGVYAGRFCHVLLEIE